MENILMLGAENIQVMAGGKKILNGVSFHAYPGEILAIVGANGAGKSTLLKVISGDTSFTGKVILNGKNLNAYKKSELARFRSVLTQSFSLTAPFKVTDVVLMGRYPFFNEMPSLEDREIVEEAMHLTDVYHFKEKNYMELSGGEKQRVHLARVIAQILTRSGTPEFLPNYLFLDEPVSSLDILHQHKTLAIAKTLKQRGYVIITVLHDLNLTAQYADKVLMLREGEVMAYGAMNQVMNTENIFSVFDVHVSIIKNKETPYPFIITEPFKENMPGNKVLEEALQYGG
jgi:iron complex transport system ATP-binding protein